jgi:hypothetical protein
MTLVYPLLYYAFPQQLSLFLSPTLGFCSTSPLPTTATQPQPDLHLLCRSYALPGALVTPSFQSTTSLTSTLSQHLTQLLGPSLTMANKAQQDGECTRHTKKTDFD